MLYGLFWIDIKVLAPIQVDVQTSGGQSYLSEPEALVGAYFCTASGPYVGMLEGEFCPPGSGTEFNNAFELPRGLYRLFGHTITGTFSVTADFAPTLVS